MGQCKACNRGQRDEQRHTGQVTGGGEAADQQEPAVSRALPQAVRGLGGAAGGAGGGAN